MLRRIVVFTLIVFFATGTLVAMAGDKSAGQEKSGWQCAYNWFAGLDKACAKTAENCCRACGKICCKTCQTDCGGKCCSACCKKQR